MDCPWAGQKYRTVAALRYPAKAFSYVKILNILGGKL